MAKTLAERISADLKIRWMIRRDMPEVLEIENEVFPNPDTEQEFRDYLRNRNVIGMVSVVGETKEERGKVVGYMVYELHKSKLIIDNFAVSPWYWRSGVGRRMVEKLKGKLSRERRRRLECFIREGNLDAQLFFKAMGFVAEEIRYGHYGELSEEDAYLFAYEI